MGSSSRRSATTARSCKSSRSFLYLVTGSTTAVFLPPSSTRNCLLGALIINPLKSPNIVYKRFITLARYPAPKPLSMFTTQTLGEQLLSMPSSAARPRKLAPYPMLEGTAMIGAFAGRSGPGEGSVAEGYQAFLDDGPPAQVGYFWGLLGLCRDANRLRTAKATMQNHRSTSTGRPGLDPSCIWAAGGRKGDERK